MPIDGDYFLACMAAYIVLKKDNKFFLMRRKNTNWCNGFYNIPAGRVERHETMQTCAIRELKEEAGVDVDLADLKLFLVANRYDDSGSNKQPDWIDFFYVAEKWQGNPHVAEPEKCDHADWFDLDDPTIQIIPNIMDALQYLDRNQLCYTVQNYTNQKVA